MVENQNVNINLLHIVPWCTTAQGLHQLGTYTNPNKCIVYHRTLYPTEYTLAWTKLYPDLTWTGYSQHGLCLRLNRPRPIYIRVYYGLSQFISRGIFWLEGV